MDLKELHSFKMSDAVTFHDNLNSKLFRGQHLQPAVELQLKTIAQDFLQEMGIHDLDVRDITVSGSNAAYSYTDHSDLDLHILVEKSSTIIMAVSATPSTNATFVEGFIRSSHEHWSADNE